MGKQIAAVYRYTFTNRFAIEGEKGMVIYVPITILKEMGVRLASNGVILCRGKIPFAAIQAIFELDGSRGMGPRIQSPSLVDEYVCESMFGEDFMRASGRRRTIQGRPPNPLHLPQQRIIDVTKGSEWTPDQRPMGKQRSLSITLLELLWIHAPSLNAVAVGALGA